MLALGFLLLPLAYAEPVSMSTCDFYGRLAAANVFKGSRCIEHFDDLSGQYSQAVSRLSLKYPKWSAALQSDEPWVKQAREIGTFTVYTDPDADPSLSRESCSQDLQYLNLLATAKDWETTMACWR